MLIPRQHVHVHFMLDSTSGVGSELYEKRGHDRGPGRGDGVRVCVICCVCGCWLSGCCFATLFFHFFLLAASSYQLLPNGCEAAVSGVIQLLSYLQLLLRTVREAQM